MFDFRYHAVSLAAVLIALVVGLLLGVAIGDAGLVSSAEKSVRESLRSDIKKANNRAAATQKLLDAERRYSTAAYPLLVAGRLDGQKIGLLFLGNPSESIVDDVRGALTGTNGRLVGILAVREPPDLQALSDAAGSTRYSQLAQDPSLLEPFGRRVGIQLVQGGALVRSEADALFSTRSGSLGPFDAVVVCRNPPADLQGDAKQQTADLEDGIMRGLTDNPVAVVGVQQTTTDPSQVLWYRAHDISSVDNIDQRAGRAALVFTLSGATGSFGVGPQAQSLLPGPESITPAATG
ncbi:MAG TPA: copper transporter [Solirubrobacteraceae bacterium]|nr:copper transporter [Solirubrobacteraceae bacterium]